MYYRRCQRDRQNMTQIEHEKKKVMNLTATIFLKMNETFPSCP